MIAGPGSWRNTDFTPCVRSAYRCIYNDGAMGRSTLHRCRMITPGNASRGSAFPRKFACFGGVCRQKESYTRDTSSPCQTVMCGAWRRSLAGMCSWSARQPLASSQGVNWRKLPRVHPETWAKDLIDLRCCSEKSAAIILCGMWALWMARNKRRHGESCVLMRMAVEWAGTRHKI